MRKLWIAIALALALVAPPASARMLGRASAVGRNAYQPWRGLGVDLPNNFSIDLLGGTLPNDRVELADNAALECAGAAGDEQCTFFMRMRLDTHTAGRDYLTKWDQTGANSRSFSKNCGTTAGSPAQCNIRLSLCPDTACATQFSVTTQHGAWSSLSGIDVIVTLNYSVTPEQFLIYADGALQSITEAGTRPTSWPNSSANWTIFARNAGENNNESDGQVDDFGIDPDHAWTAAEVWAWHNRRQSARMPTGITVGTWCRGGDDNGGSGTTCTDYSGNGLHWTIAGTDAATAIKSNTYFSKILFASPTTTNATRQDDLGLGQSNMSGRGAQADFGASQDDELPNRARVYNFGNAGPIGSPNGSVNPAVEPIDDATGAVFAVSDDGVLADNVGPMLAWADYMATQWTHHNVGIVPCSRGGTEAIEWLPSHNNTNRLFGSCESRWASSARGAGDVACIGVYQGEQDAQTTVEALNWKYRWAAIVEGVRDSLNKRDIPVVFVRLPPTVPTPGSSYTQWASLRSEQATVCGLLDHCTVVDAPDGPWVDVNNLHLATSTQLVVGDLIGAACVASAYGQIVTP